MRRTIAVLIAYVVAFGGPAAFAAEWGSCNGYAIKWRSRLVVHRNTCTLPNGPKADMFFNSLAQWQFANTFVGGLVDQPSNDCSLTFTNDGVNEVALVSPQQIDDRFGLTILHFNKGCNWSAGWLTDAVSISGFDLAVRNDFSRWEDPFEGSDGVQAWDTMLHEFGHAFGGLGHDSTFMSVMSAGTDPLVGGTGRHAQLMPRDRYKIISLYGKVWNPTNLAATGQVVRTNPFSIGLNDPPQLTRVCRGNMVNIAFTLLNQSSGHAVGPFHNRVRVSTEFSGHGGDGWTVAEWDHTLGPWAADKVPVSFMVPWDFPIGQAGYIYVDVDWFQQVNETDESDNHIKIMELLHVVC